jgi:hypothetical protein
LILTNDFHWGIYLHVILFHFISLLFKIYRSFLKNVFKMMKSYLFNDVELIKLLVKNCCLRSVNSVLLYFCHITTSNCQANISRISNNSSQIFPQVSSQSYSRL